LDPSLTLACALKVEEDVARKAGAQTTRVGLGVTLPLPEGRLVSFGFAGGLVPDLERGALLTATRIVSEGGETLWEGEPIELEGARRAVICSTDRVIDDPGERQQLAERTGAVAVDMESGKLAASGRLAGIVRAVSDSPTHPLGVLATAAKADGSTDWKVVARSVVVEPVKTGRALIGAKRARASLQRAAEALR
jgi:nucleoside phosphorylase